MLSILQSGCSLSLTFTVNHYDRLHINSNTVLLFLRQFIAVIKISGFDHIKQANFILLKLILKNIIGGFFYSYA